MCVCVWCIHRLEEAGGVDVQHQLERFVRMGAVLVEKKPLYRCTYLGYEHSKRELMLPIYVLLYTNISHYVLGTKLVPN